MPRHASYGTCLSLVLIWQPVATSLSHAAVAPYTSDANTLHLYHFNEIAGSSDPGNPFLDNNGGVTDRNLTDTGGPDGRDNSGGGGYGAATYTGFGSAFDVLAAGNGTYHSTQSSVGGGAQTGSAFAQSELQGSNGAFTYEALIKIAVNDTMSEQNIICHDGDATRGFSFRVINGTLSLSNGTNTWGAMIPTTGTHAFAAGQWFHTAVTYDGNAGAANNLKFYWTRLDSGAAQANQIGAATMAADLSSSASNKLGVGVKTRSPYRFELKGSIDEIRISNVARSATQFLFSSGAGGVPVYAVTELSFIGPTFSTSQAPAKDVDFWVNFRHTDGTNIKVWGFHDGNGAGGASGNVFKVRFCPTKPGVWTLQDVFANAAGGTLNNQREGETLTAVSSGNKGFWVVDTASAGQRWYKRSDGSHPFINGNTHYTFLTGYANGSPTGSGIAADITNNVPYFKKVRFSVVGDGAIHANPNSKPFFDASGVQTTDGDHSHRPNASWFHNRADVAVQEAFNHDLIADLILCGVNTDEGRSPLEPENNALDATPYLKYIAARYGSYPNVWICMANEYNHPTFTPNWTQAEMVALGNILRSYLPYPTPVSVHPFSGQVWNSALNDSTPPIWNDHAILQWKLKDLSDSTDKVTQSYSNAGSNKPVINDENGYQGAGDGYSEGDIIEAQLGSFAGGGYATTGYKTGAQQGQYFWGAFNATDHSASDNLQWLRQKIEQNITFWNMAPVAMASSIFTGADSTNFRAMQWANNQYVLVTDASDSSITANLPAGTWTVKRFDAAANPPVETTLSTSASGVYTFSSPSSRAVLFFFKKNP